MAMHRNSHKNIIAASFIFLYITVSFMGKMRNCYKSLLAQLEGKKQLGSPKHR
jgi:hypothetical protein